MITLNAASGEVGVVLVWSKIDDGQTPDWTGVNDTQSPNWSVVNDSQSPDWKNVA